MALSNGERFMGLKGWRGQVSSLGVKGGGNGTIAYEKKFMMLNYAVFPCPFRANFGKKNA